MQQSIDIEVDPEATTATIRVPPDLYEAVERIARPDGTITPKHFVSAFNEWCRSKGAAD